MASNSSLDQKKDEYYLYEEEGETIKVYKSEQLEDDKKIKNTYTMEEVRKHKTL